MAGLCARGPKEEAPLYDDGPTCPYKIKPSHLFDINEVRGLDREARGSTLVSQCLQKLDRSPPPRSKKVLPSSLSSSPRLQIHRNTTQRKDSSALAGLGGVQGLAGAIGSDADRGLDPSAPPGAPAGVEEHGRVFGANRVKAVPPKSFFALCWENIQDPIILLLILAALVRGGGAASCFFWAGATDMDGGSRSFRPARQKSS